jgi:hypothetical protein
MRLGETDAIGAGNVIVARPFPSVPRSVDFKFRQFRVSPIPASLILQHNFTTNSDQLGQDHATGKHAIVRDDDKAEVGVDPAALPPSLAMVIRDGKDVRTGS